MLPPLPSGTCRQFHRHVTKGSNTPAHALKEGLGLDPWVSSSYCSGASSSHGRAAHLRKHVRECPTPVYAEMEVPFGCHPSADSAKHQNEI